MSDLSKLSTDNISLDSKDNKTYTSGPDIALFGVTGLAVVVDGDKIIVCPKDEVDEIYQREVQLRCKI